MEKLESQAEFRTNKMYKYHICVCSMCVCVSVYIYLQQEENTLFGLLLENSTTTRLDKKNLIFCILK